MILLGVGLMLCILITIRPTLCQVRSHYDEYCMTEFFRPQCLKNEVILVKNATYGRMRVGRCLTAEEVEAHRAITGDDPRYFGCSVDVLEILDKKCSGQMACEVRVVEILEKNIRPCFAGLMVFLEASYECIAVVDEKRSCVVKASINPIHIIDSSANQLICGTGSHPWIIESPVGQKISLTLIDFKDINTKDGKIEQCSLYGTITDKANLRNISICGGRGQRQRKVYTSKGNNLEIYIGSNEFKESVSSEIRFIIGVESVGCSDIVPPEDTWLKRKDDAVVIGCYSTRQTWQLSCNEGKWNGVLGNCSLKANSDNQISDVKEAAISMNLPTISDQEQVLAIVAICGCTFAICLIIVCVGAIFLRRFYIRYKNQHDYKTLGISRTIDVNQQLNREPVYMDENEHNANFKQLPTYSVYVGDNTFKDNKDNSNSLINNINQ